MKFFHKGKAAVLSTVFAISLSVSAYPAQAFVIYNGWELDLSVINGVADSGGNVLAGLGSATNVDRAEISGDSVIAQKVVGGSALGQSFEENGALQFTGYRTEGGGAVQLFDLGDTMVTLYATFDGLTGILNADSTITFDPNVGTIKLWLDSDSDLDPATGDVLQLVEWDIIAPSGGSDLNFYGGGGANATIDVTLEVLSIINNALFQDKFGNNLNTFFISLANVDALLDEDVQPNPDNSGIDVNGDGTSYIYTENGGQFKIAAVPEPASLALMGIGLIGFGAGAIRRRRSRS